MSLDFSTTYVPVADADAYHQARGNVTWDGVDAVKAQAIRRATDFIVGRYAGSWIEEPDPADLPEAFTFAICEAALRELQKPGVLTPDMERGGAIKSIQAGSVGIVYMDGATVDTVVSTIDNLLRILIFAGGVSRIVRA